MPKLKTKETKLVVLPGTYMHPYYIDYIDVLAKNANTSRGKVIMSALREMMKLYSPELYEKSPDIKDL